MSLNTAEIKDILQSLGYHLSDKGNFCRPMRFLEMEIIKPHYKFIKIQGFGEIL